MLPATNLESKFCKTLESDTGGIKAQTCAEESDVKTLFIGLALAAFPAFGHGLEQPLVWPQVRGPNGSGVAEPRNEPRRLQRSRTIHYLFEPKSIFTLSPSASNCQRV